MHTQKHSMSNIFSDDQLYSPTARIKSNRTKKLLINENHCTTSDIDWDLLAKFHMRVPTVWNSLRSDLSGNICSMNTLEPRLSLIRAQPVSVARRPLIERSVTWLAIESVWARGKRSAICSGKLCEGFTIFEQCCPCDWVSIVWCKLWFQWKRSNFNGKSVRFQQLWSKKTY